MAETSQRKDIVTCIQYFVFVSAHLNNPNSSVRDAALHCSDFRSHKDRLIMLGTMVSSR